MSQLTFRDVEQIALTTAGSEQNEQRSVGHYKQWLDICKKKRAFAFTHALRHPGLAARPEFETVQRSFHLPYVMWHLRLVLHVWPAPQESCFWEGSVTLVTEYPGTENEFGHPEEGTPFFINWTREQKEEGRRMLDDVFGDIIRYLDDMQRVFVHEGSTHIGIKILYEPQHLGWLYRELQ